MISEGQLVIEVHFTMGNSTPDTDTAADDITTGILDLNREYTISMDIIAVEDKATTTSDICRQQHQQ